MASYFTNNTNQALHDMCRNYLSGLTSHCYLLHLLYSSHIELLDVPPDVRHIPASGPLHMWFPLLQRLFSQISMYLTLSHLSGIFANVTFSVKTSLTSIDFSPAHISLPPSQLSLFPFSASFFSVAYFYSNCCSQSMYFIYLFCSVRCFPHPYYLFSSFKL